LAVFTLAVFDFAEAVLDALDLLLLLVRLLVRLDFF